MEISGTKKRINLPAVTLFEKANDFRNFSDYLTDEVKVIATNEDSCTFAIENIATITMKIVEKTPFTLIRFIAENDKNIPFFITLNFTEISENETDVEVVLDIDVPIFLKPVLQSPLQRFVNTLSEKISLSAEKTGS